MKTRLAVIASLAIAASLFLFLAPVIPVEGSQVFPAGHCPPITWKWTDWQSVGYYSLGIGYSMRVWAQRDFCL